MFTLQKGDRGKYLIVTKSDDGVTKVSTVDTQAEVEATLVVNNYYGINRARVYLAYELVETK